MLNELEHISYRSIGEFFFLKIELFEQSSVEGRSANAKKDNAKVIKADSIMREENKVTKAVSKQCQSKHSVRKTSSQSA